MGGGGEEGDVERVVENVVKVLLGDEGLVVMKESNDGCLSAVGRCLFSSSLLSSSEKWLIGSSCTRSRLLGGSI